MLIAVGAAACSSYDHSVIDERLRAAQGGRPALVVDASSQLDAGEAMPDAPLPIETCGNGKVELDEKCDIGIPMDWPGACPRRCPPIADCIARELSGSNCQAECVVLTPVCASGDGCCPMGCAHDTDEDCSQYCGDGTVQEDMGETCEIAAPDGGAPDPDTECAQDESDCDDGDACSLDLFTGSALSCSAACSHAPVTALVAGDGCCPVGANANNDDDCQSQCGNGVREPGEECDDSEGCDSSCKLTLTSEQMACLASVQETGNACDICSCMQCASERQTCTNGGDASRDMHCAEIIQCANDHDCVGGACYCADSLCWYPGPCRSEIDMAVWAEAAAGTVSQQEGNPATAVGRAKVVSDCKAMRCSDVCP